MYYATGEVYLASNSGDGVYRVNQASISTTNQTVKVVYVSPSGQTSSNDGMNCLTYGDPFPKIPECPPPPHPTAAGLGTVNYGRCGEDYGDLLCAESAGRYCNEATGSCGDTAAFRDAQESTTYDSSRLQDHCTPSPTVTPTRAPTSNPSWSFTITGERVVFPERPEWLRLHCPFPWWPKLVYFLVALLLCGGVMHHTLKGTQVSECHTAYR
jgi:hypothetical protein